MTETMLIGIDASRYQTDSPTGIEWYSYHLINHLIPLLGRYHEHQFIVYLSKPVNFREELPFNVKTKLIKPPRLWTAVGLSLEMILHKPDILFVPSYLFPFFAPKKSVITIHDIAFMTPEISRTYSWKDRLWFKWALNKQIKKASTIIVPSLTTKNDLIEIMKCPAEKISVVYHGGPENELENNPALKKWTAREIEAMFKRFQINEKDQIILYIGRIESKKNLANLIEAFSKYLKEYPDWKLLLAGKDGQDAEKIKLLPAQFGIEGNVIFSGYITEAEKLFLLEKCRIFSFVTKYEGFGLPILEAWAMRRPVLTSSNSACKEIAEGAAVLANPDSIAEISVGLKRLTFDAILKNKLIAAGEAKLALYNWEKAAQETLEVLLG